MLTANQRGRYETIRSDSQKWGQWVESAVGAHLVSGAEENDLQVFYWRDRQNEVDFVLSDDDSCVAFEVKSGRRSMNVGIPEFVKNYNPRHTYIIGTGGIPLEDFLSISIEQWFE